MVPAVNALRLRANALLHHRRMGAFCHVCWRQWAVRGGVAESVLGHMIPGVAGAYNRHQYDAERVEWLRRLSERLEELARPG